MALFGSDEQIHSLALKVKNGGLSGAWNTQADAGLKQTFSIEKMIRDLTIYLRQPAPDVALADVGFYVLQNKTSGDNLWKS